MRNQLLAFGFVIAVELGSLCCSVDAPPDIAPHIVLITADALRADHLSLTGYPRSTSPEIDAFAENAWVFDQALYVIPKTAPSFATLFSGRHPREHGVRSNFAKVPEASLCWRKSSRRLATAPPRSWGTPHSRVRRVSRAGFDVYELVLSREDAMGALLEAFLSWSESDWSQPTFVWIHALDPHGPYSPADDRFLGDQLSQQEAEVRLGYAKGSRPNKVLGAVPRYQQRRDGEKRVAPYVARYDGEILGVDRLFGEVIT